METSYTLFREYILWRSKVVVYVAVFVVIIAVISLGVLVGSGAANVNRFGLFLQLVGVLALGPDIIGKQRFQRSASPLPVTGPDGGAIEPPSSEPQANQTGFDFITYYQANNPLIALGNVLVSLAAMGWMAVLVFDPLASQSQEDWLARTLLALLGFAWLNLFMLIQIFRLFGRPVPAEILAGFFTLDLPVSICGMLFAAAAHVLFRWVGWGLGFIFENGIRRVLLAITMPCLIAGLFLELLATFL